MKRILFIIYIFLIVMIICPIETKAGTAATLQPSDFEMECVYDNGMVLTFYEMSGTYAVGVSSLTLSNQVSPPYSSELTAVYNEAQFSKKVLNSAQCPTNLGYGVLKQTNSSGGELTFQVVFDTNDVGKVSSGELDYDYDFVKSNIIAGFTATDGYFVSFLVEDDSILAKRLISGYMNKETGERYAAGFRFQLVSERMMFNNYVPTDSSHSWYFKSEGSQAVSKSMYVKVSEYWLNGTKIQVIEKDGNSSKLTTNLALESSDQNKIQAICFAQAVKTLVGDNSVGYSFSNIRHNAYLKVSYDDYSSTRTTLGKAYARGDSERILTYIKTLTCSSDYTLYYEIPMEEAQGEGTSGTSICDIMPETAIYLAKIIKYTQIIVPCFLIILTAVDIARIVLAGNIEEELPKRKKTIIIRLIVSIVFFFLPLFVQIIVSSSYGVDFGDISCLFK